MYKPGAWVVFTSALAVLILAMLLVVVQFKFSSGVKYNPVPSSVRSLQVVENCDKVTSFEYVYN